MDNLLALAIIAIAIAYSEPANGSLFTGFVLPLLGVSSAYYLLRVAGSTILVCGVVIYHFMDISSPSVFRSVILPVMLGLTVIVFGLWAWKQDTARSGDGWADAGTTGSGLGGGDCGGDGGGCG